MPEKRGGKKGAYPEKKMGVVAKAVNAAAVDVIGYVVPAALHRGAMDLLPQTKEKSGIVARLVGEPLGHKVGEKVAHMALSAMTSAEASALQAIESALPVSGVAAYEPPAELYAKRHTECNKVRPTLDVFAMALTEAMQAMGQGECDEVVELYAQVVDRGKFEAALCGDDGEEAEKLEVLIREIPRVVEQSTETAVALAEMLRDKPSGKMRDAMYEAAVRAAEPVRGFFWDSKKGLEDLRNLEVVVRQLRAGEGRPEFVRDVREATWRAVVEGGKINMTRLGSRYGFVPLPVLRDPTVQLSPDPVPNASDAVNFGLGEWGLLNSLRRVVEFAVERFKQSDPEKAAKVAAYAERGRSLGQELLGLYVVRQHVGFEPPGTGYALAVAVGTLRALPRTKAYAHAVRCMLVYIRALLQDAGTGADVDKITKEVAKITKPSAEPDTKYEIPTVPLACRGGPVGHDARTRRLVRDACAKNGELVEKAQALEWLKSTFGSVAADITVDEMFEKHDALGALASQEWWRVGQKTKQNVAQTLARMRKEPSLSVVQRRRLEVVQTRVKEASGGNGAVDDAGAEVYKHLVERAKEGKPHGLSAHELGVAHTAFYVGPTVVYRAPMVEAEAPAHGSWMGTLLARLSETLVPDRVQSVVAAATDAASGRKVQYRGSESPGVGYALYALLPVLDHASVMKYDAVKGHTLRAVGSLLHREQSKLFV